MKTKEKREANFRKDLEKLLKKHCAEIQITDDGASWGMHSAICIITMETIYDMDANIIEEWCEFNL